VRSGLSGEQLAGRGDLFLRLVQHFQATVDLALQIETGALAASLDNLAAYQAACQGGVA